MITKNNKILKKTIRYGIIILQIVLLYLFIELGGIWTWVWIITNIIISLIWVYYNWFTLVMIADFIYYHSTGTIPPKREIRKKDIYEWFESEKK